VVEVGLHRFSDEGEDAPGLLATGFDDGEDRLHEPTSPFTLRAARQLPPDHRVTQGSLGAVVRGFDPSTSRNVQSHS
jgi:hypothetical protein